MISDACHRLIGAGKVDRQRGHREAAANDDATTIFHSCAKGFQFVQREFALLRHDVVLIDESVMNDDQSIRPVALPRTVPTA